MTCVECNKPADYVRCTQFAGEHPYCKEHAEQEPDFMQEDDYLFWKDLGSETNK